MSTSFVTGASRGIGEAIAMTGFEGRNIEAQDVCRELGLAPGWPG